MKIIWLDSALFDLRSLAAYISTDNPAAAKQQVLRIISDSKFLTKFPRMGRTGRCKNTREWIVGKTPYIVAYRIRGKTIEILRVMHGNRQWPQKF